METIENRLKEIENRLNILEGNFMQEDTFSMKYADINGILLKRENEKFRYCKHFTWDEAMLLFNDVNGCRIPSREEWEKMLELGHTWDKDKKGIWIGKNHSGKEETNYSTFLPAAGYLHYNDSSLNNCGGYGYYMSTSKRSDTYVYQMSFCGDKASMYYDCLRNGLSVRCIVLKQWKQFGI